MKKKEPLNPKQVGERVRERRTELGLSMPELGKRIGVNKSTIQRYEADGVDPKRTMIINGLSEALLTTPEWLTGLSDEKEFSTYTLCQTELEKHTRYYLGMVTSSVKVEEHQQLLTGFLGGIVDLFALFARYWSLTMDKIDKLAEDQGLKESIGKYAINIGTIAEQVFRKEMEVPVDDMKRYLDGMLRLYDTGKTKAEISELFGMVDQARMRLIEKESAEQGNRDT